jgi:hypothetical protein
MRQVLPELIEVSQLLPELIEVSKLVGFEFDIPYFKNHYSFKNIYFTFRPTNKQVRKFVNTERVSLCSSEEIGAISVAVYDFTPEVCVSLIEVWKNRGKKTYLEAVKLRYYDFGKEEPTEKVLGHIKVGSASFIGLMAKSEASKLIEALVRSGWQVYL